MRVFLPALVLVQLLCLSLPINGAAFDGDSLDARSQKSHAEVAKRDDSGGSWISFLNPSHIIESIQNATTAVLDFFTPSDKPGSESDFWEIAKSYEEHLEEYVSGLLRNAAEQFENSKFLEVTYTVGHIVNATTSFRNDIQGAMDAHQVTFDVLTKELEAVFVEVVNDVKNIPPPDEAPGHADRAKAIDMILDHFSLALTNFAASIGIEEGVVSTFLSTLRPLIHTLIVTVADINEQYPQLFPTVAFCVAMLVLSELPILRPLLDMFGFSPAGPVKGSIAAWLQRTFWGGAVESGSWFALLQTAAMTIRK